MDSNLGAPKTFPKELATMAMLVVVLWGAWAAQAFFIPIFLAALLAFLGAPMVRWLRAHRVPEWLALVLTTLTFLVPFLWLTFMLFRQVQSLVSDYPSIVRALQGWVTQLGASPWGQRFNLHEHLTTDALISHIGSSASEGFKIVVHALRTLLEAGTELALISIFAFVMLASREHLYRSAERLLEQLEGIESSNVLSAVTEMIETFLITKILVILIVGVMSFLALQVLGLKYAFLLGMLTGILTLLPEIGFVVSLLPILLVALVTGHGALSCGGIMLAMVLVHLVEANYFTPILVGKKLNLNVLSTFVGLFAGGLLWGVWGMLLSVPVLGVLRIIFSATPRLQPWAFLLSEKEDRQFGLSLMSKTLRAERLSQLLRAARAAQGPLQESK